MSPAPLRVPTSYGTLAAYTVQAAWGEAVVLRRHGALHGTPPHRVPYRAMADGLRRLGVRACLATAAVGSLRTEWQPGAFVTVADFLDFTGRRLTMHDTDVVHTDMTVPAPAARHFAAAALRCGIAVHAGAVYATLDGPRYETPSEIEMVRRLGGDLVGMTAGTEAVLMREAGIEYGCLAVVSNLAAGMAPGELAHGDVTAEVAKREQELSALVAAALESAAQG
jgi:5'-methylthioadenosine phosphorylase